MEREDEVLDPIVDSSRESRLPPSPRSAVSTSIPASRPGRRLRLVVTLQPEAPGGYRVLLAVGADGCDPLLHSVGVAEWGDVLEQIPSLLAEAEARWQIEPRYPAAGGKIATGAPPRPEPPPGPAPAAPLPAPARPARSGQLSLFD